MVLEFNEVQCLQKFTDLSLWFLLDREYEWQNRKMRPMREREERE